jgi:hypothetical protein
MRLRLPSALNACALTWLAGWLADMERCSCIILHSCKNHELLLMSFPCSCWKSSWIPNKSLELSICSILLLLLLASAAAAAASFLLPSCSLLAVSADFNISSDLLITSSSCSSGWSVLAVSSAAKIFGHWEDHMISHAFLHQFPTSPVGCARPALLPFPPGLQLIPQISKANVVCLFFLCFCNLLCCSVFSFSAENIEPFLRMLSSFVLASAALPCCSLQLSALQLQCNEPFLRMLISFLLLFLCCQLQCYSSFSLLAEIIELFLRTLLLFSSSAWAVSPNLLQFFFFDSHHQL